ncbi:hypothetical protein FPV67DRAFT_1679829 [Lyophyllum atratum]|nr:hypothetical protein FPV67DRAFT_1679829 [Lyophyllum atratum]
MAPYQMYPFNMMPPAVDVSVVQNAVQESLHAHLPNAVVQEVTKQVTDLEERLAELIAEKMAGSMAATASTVGKQKQKRNTDEKCLIQKKMLSLIGVEKYGARRVPELPPPLAADEPAHDRQRDLLASLRHQISENDQRRFMEKAKSYFRNLSGVYKARNEEAAKMKREEKIINGRRNVRKKKEANDLREAIKPFREQYGEGNTVGVEDALATDFLFSEVTDDKALAPASSRIQPKVLKVTPVGWHERNKLPSSFESLSSFASA